MSATKGRVAKKRSLPQNRLYWRLLEHVAANWTPNDQVFHKVSWHLMFKHKYLAPIAIPLPSGEVVTKLPSTRDLPMFAPEENPDDPNCWENFFGQVEAYCAEYGYTLEASDDQG